MADLEESAAVEQPVDDSAAGDLRATLAESLKGNDTEASPPPEAKETEAEKAERARDEKGRFAAKEAGEAEATPPAGEQKTEAAPEAAKSTEVGQTPSEGASGAVEAPVHWPVADREKFAALPAEARSMVLDFQKKMEAGFTPKLMRLSQYERDFQGVPEIFAPYAEEMRQRGVTPAHFINTWANVELALNEGARAARQGLPNQKGAAIVAAVIEKYGVNPGDVAELLRNPQAAQAASQPAQLPPEMAQAIQEARSAAEEVRQYREREQSKALTSAQSMIDTFVAEKDSDGNLKHPFFADLQAEIEEFAQLDVAKGKTPNLSDLYDRAVWANPSIRQRQLASEKEREAKRAAVERQAKSQAAARAASSVSGSPGTGQSLAAKPNPAASSADDLRASLAEMRQ